MAVAVNDEEVHRAPHIIIITFVVGQCEVIKVKLAVGLTPVVVSNGREEEVARCSGSVRSNIRVNVFVIILPDVLIIRR